MLAGICRFSTTFCKFKSGFCNFLQIEGPRGDRVCIKKDLLCYSLFVTCVPVMDVHIKHGHEHRNSHNLDVMASSCFKHSFLIVALYDVD